MSVAIPTETRSKQPTTASGLSVKHPSPLTQPGAEAVRTGILGKRLTVGVAAVVVLAAAGFVLLGSGGTAGVQDVITYSISRGDLIVSVTENGILASSNNERIKCEVEGGSTILSIVEDGANVKEGDVLVTLDTSTIEDNVNQQKIAYEAARSTFVQSQSDVAIAEIAIQEYEEGTFRAEQKTAAMNVVTAEANLRNAQNVLEHSKRLYRRGFINELQLKADEETVTHYELELEVMNTTLDALERFTKAKTLEELRSTFKAKQAKLKSDEAALALEKARLDRVQKQLENCKIMAEFNGTVIYPPQPEWKQEPEIAEGATVRERQTLLIIPDMKKIQVEVAVHETRVDQIHPDMKARVEIQDQEYSGTVTSIAKQASPSGWWDGNARRFDVHVQIEQLGRTFKPGMSAEAEIIIAHHKDVITVPVAAVVELGQEIFCWVQTDDGLKKRKLDLGPSNDQFIVVDKGLEEGEQVVINPADVVDEIEKKARTPSSDSLADVADVEATDSKSGSSESKKTSAAPSTKNSSPNKKK